MKGPNKSMETLSTIEKAINEMAELRQHIILLKELETQTQMAMEALQASEKKYRTLVDNIPQKLFMKDKNLVYVFCNQSYAKDLKIKPDEISGKVDYDFFPGELANKYSSDDKRIMEAGKLERSEERYIVGGQTFTVHMVKTPVQDEKGDLLGILGIFWDITEQKRNEEEIRKYRAHLEETVSTRIAELQTANKQLEREITERKRLEEKLRQREEEYRTLLENTGTPTIILEEDRTISVANTEFEKLSGYAKEAVEGKKSWTEFVAQDDLARMEEYLQARETTLESLPPKEEFRFIGKQGNVQDILITMAMIPGTKKIVASLLDITDHKRTEESLRMLEERYQVLIEHAKEAMIVVQDGLIKFSNPPILGITGYSQDELMLRPFEAFIHPDDREMVELHTRKLEQGELPYAGSFKMIHKNGSIRWVDNSGALIQWDGESAILNFITDITDRRQAEDELRKSMQQIRVMVDAMEKILLTLNREPLE
jgi:PAS domain S-box-containing protein